MSKSRIFIGIDNGLNGALVALDGRSNVLSKFVMPTVGRAKGNEVDAAALRDLLLSIVVPAGKASIDVALEVPGKFSRGTQALTSMWDSFGVCRAVLSVMQLRHHRLRPNDWQRVMLPGCKKGDTKPAAKARAGQLWPEERWLASDRCRVPHDGLIDAALIAEYIRMKH
jgi:hypothetical protein